MLPWDSSEIPSARQIRSLLAFKNEASAAARLAGESEIAKAVLRWRGLLPSQAGVTGYEVASKSLVERGISSGWYQVMQRRNGVCSGVPNTEWELLFLGTWQDPVEKSDQMT